MKRSNWKKWVALLTTGAAVLQATTSCNRLATGVITASSVVTAGGVLYIIDRIVRN